MVSAFASGLSGLGLSPGQGQLVLLLGKMLPQCLSPTRCISVGSH